MKLIILWVCSMDFWFGVGCLGVGLITDSTPCLVIGAAAILTAVVGAVATALVWFVEILMDAAPKERR